MCSFTDTALHIASLVAGLLLGLFLTPIGASAQVQIDQVQQATGQVQGASQAEVIVATGDEVSSGRILNLVQEVSPPTTTDGNSAAVRQDGTRNDVAIRQAGTRNRAVAEQIGTGNKIVITQDGGSLPSSFKEDVPGTDAAFEALRRLRPVTEKAAT
jgi:Curlin associated repeat.